MKKSIKLLSIALLSVFLFGCENNNDSNESGWFLATDTIVRVDEPRPNEDPAGASDRDKATYMVVTVRANVALYVTDRTVVYFERPSGSGRELTTANNLRAGMTIDYRYDMSTSDYSVSPAKIYPTDIVYYQE